MRSYQVPALPEPTGPVAEEGDPDAVDRAAGDDLMCYVMAKEQIYNV